MQRRVKAVSENMYFIESFHGKSFSGDPKYIALWVKKHMPDAQIFVSSVNQLVDIEVRYFGFEPLRLGSAEYQRKFEQSKYIIVNGNTLDKVGKSPNQIIIQTWHGFPLKKNGRRFRRPETAQTRIKCLFTSDEKVELSFNILLYEH